MFKVHNQSVSGVIDVASDGRVYAKRLQSELAGVIYEVSMTRERLIRWLDERIKHPEVTKPSAIAFIDKALTLLEEAGHDFETLVQHKYALKRALVCLVEDLRDERGENNYRTLFETRRDHFKTSSDIGMIFDELTYGFNWPYDGHFIFNKHYTPIVGDLKSAGEEFDCACHIDAMEEVVYWIRNVESKPHSFWLQLPNGKFYPDFVVRLKDGRTLIVEYKGEHLVTADDAQAKDLIGRIWAEKSNGTCLFIMVSECNFQSIDNHIS